ncbi:oxygenase MpaB family protein [Streptomyces bohaiensis]|uniref:oxygenase MpaB family protein n=1 Tax=Streptomyces bohaiensis TaxID=1431344 RepID=UPI003B7C114B
MTAPHQGPAAPSRRTAPPVGPPPDGMLWAFYGDVRFLMWLPAALALQVALPGVGAGVDEHSVFRTDPWGRADRSVRSALLWVYGGEEAAAEGRRLRRLHRSIAGTTPDGRRYHSLDPHLYGWVHATGFPVMLRALAVLHGRDCTPQEQEALYREWRTVGVLLGLRDRDLPDTAAEFEPRYRAWLDELVATPVVRELTDPRNTVGPPDHGPRAVRVPLRIAWPLLRRPTARLLAFLTVGLMPSEARAAVGLAWSDRQERRLRLLGRATAAVVTRLPERLRYLPDAARARRVHRALH